MKTRVPSSDRSFPSAYSPAFPRGRSADASVFWGIKAPDSPESSPSVRPSSVRITSTLLTGSVLASSNLTMEVRKLSPKKKRNYRCKHRGNVYDTATQHAGKHSPPVRTLQQLPELPASLLSFSQWKSGTESFRKAEVARGCVLQNYAGPPGNLFESSSKTFRVRHQQRAKLKPTGAPNTGKDG